MEENHLIFIHIILIVMNVTMILAAVNKRKGER